MSEQEDFASTSLESLLGGGDSESALESAAEAVEARETGETGSSPDSKDDAGQEESQSGEAADADTDDDSGESKTVPLAALKAEREKYRKRIAELERQQPKAEQPKTPSVFEDEAGFNNSIDQKIKTAELRATLKLSKTQLEKEIGADGVNEVWSAFSEYMQDNPRLKQEFAESAHPFEYALQQVEKYDLLRMIETGEMDQEIESRVEAMLEEKLSAMQGESVPRSLASGASSGVSSNSYSGPAKLENILAFPD